MELSIAEQFYLIALCDDTGKLLVEREDVNVALGAGVLMELIIAGRLKVVLGRLFILDEEQNAPINPTQQAVLDFIEQHFIADNLRPTMALVLKAIRTHGLPHVKYNKVKLTSIVEQRLLEKKELTKESNFFSADKLWNRDSTHEKSICEVLRAMVLRDTPPEPESLCLLHLVETFDLLHLLFSDSEIIDHSDRLEALFEDSELTQVISNVLSLAELEAVRSAASSTASISIAASTVAISTIVLSN
ncbi:GOLPH3/VPS74 family protein [Alteromonas macleodii]|uniref:Uncharacterized protein n=1 Tax=Alteromonas macleodii TaxID=28108 RepID=A0AB36FRW1_ALTMA|nr:GPP34 family phosphoprotein [Alteromonas macleodii]OES23917.1 hypothetical protein BFV94_4965 [Alteromonas macleodii]OES24095.1 hypothetical protein BFV93_4848 [Alteromonas macleodii]OES25022.1 hypothetical protein BFV95_4490 [Alteromonas macleodii]OES38710.1 hypothetical protein BFV96_4821 [Alteromonas macleodii]